MPKENVWVVKFNEATDVYLTGWTGELRMENCSWGPIANALEFTQQGAEDTALAIGGGTVGTPK